MAPFLMFAASMLGPVDDGAEGMIRRIKAASEANVAKFRHGRVEFEILRSNQAGAGGLDELRLADTSKGKGFLAFDGEEAILRIEYEDAKVIAAAKPVDADRLTMELVPTTVLTDGRATLLNVLIPDAARPGILRSQPEIHVDPDRSLFRSNARFIYPAGDGSLFENPFARRCEELLEGDATLQSIAVEQEGGREIVRLKLATRFEVLDYTIDLSRGAIPLEVRETRLDGSVIGELFYGDIREVPGGGYLPHLKRANSPGSRLSQVMRVTGADFERPPADEEFFVRFRGPTSFTDRRSGDYLRGVRGYSMRVR